MVPMAEPKRGRGRPKNFPWDDRIDDEIHHRMIKGEAAETVEAEAKHLRLWAHRTGLWPFPNPDKINLKNPYGYERIRERLKKRYGKTEGYNKAREFHLQRLIANRKSG